MLRRIKFTYTCDKYHGNDQLHRTNGLCMEIKRIGHLVVHTPSRDHLQNALHIPTATKKRKEKKMFLFLSFANNSAFLQFHPSHFFYQGSGLEDTVCCIKPCNISLIKHQQTHLKNCIMPTSRILKDTSRTTIQQLSHQKFHTNT